MENLVKQVCHGIYGITFWSEQWNTYTNCYLIKNDKSYTLIDTSRQEDSEELKKALLSIDVKPEEVNLLIATHGHKDHIGNSQIFKSSEKYVHINDLHLIDDEYKSTFKTLNGEEGFLDEFEWTLAGGHTPGSTVFYHRKSKIIFAGDFICFFGVPMPIEGIVSKAEELRCLMLDFVSSGEFSKGMALQNLSVEDYKKSLAKIAKYDAEYLCTGHGVVLREDIQGFINNIAESVK